MARTHPYAEAAYRVIPFQDGGFGVEVSIPNVSPTTVSRFATKAAAEDWIAGHRQRVQSEEQTGRWFRRSKPRATNAEAE